MTVTLELTPEEHAALRRRAESEGTDIEAVLRGLIARLALPPPPSLDAAPDDPEEQAEHDRERAEVKANLDRWRAEQGRSPVDRGAGQTPGW